MSAFALRRNIAKAGREAQAGSSHKTTPEMTALDIEVVGLQKNPLALQPNMLVQKKTRRNRNVSENQKSSLKNDLPKNKKRRMRDVGSPPGQTTPSLMVTFTNKECASLASSTGEETLDMESAASTPASMAAQFAPKSNYGNGQEPPCAAAKYLSNLVVKGDTFSDHSTHLDLSLTDGDTVTILGQYDIWVRKGCASLLGALLHASSRVYRVYAPSTHALPTIKYVRNPFGQQNQTTQLSLYSCSTGIDSLKRCNRKFDRVWNQMNSFCSKSFQTLLGPVVQNKEMPLLSLGLDYEWQLLASRLLDTNPQTLPVILVSGVKGSGKSTFTKFLCNYLLSRRFKSCGVAVLDLDPGQPEYSPPGDISLLHLKTFNLAPPYCHPSLIGGETGKNLRSHHLGSFTPRGEAVYYVQAAHDLFDHYNKTIAHLGCPLVINTCGWMQGSGLDILMTLVKSFHPSDMILMKPERAVEACHALKKVCDGIGARFHPLDSPSAGALTKTSADLREMQFCAYFHLSKPEVGLYQWDPRPLNCHHTLNLPYAGPEQTIVGMLVLGDELNYDMLEDAIDGTVLALVAIENADFFLDEGAMDPLSNNILSCEYLKFPYATTPTMSPEFATEEIRYEPKSMGKSSRYRVSRNKHGLPYLSTGTGTNPPLNPSKTCSLGQVLVKAINKESKVVSVVTPVGQQTIRRLRESDIHLVLVKGRIGLPGWSYLEDYSEARFAQKSLKRWQKFGRENLLVGEHRQSGLNQETGIPRSSDAIPWLEQASLKSNRKGRNKLWRVRRNLTSYTE